MKNDENDQCIRMNTNYTNESKVKIMNKINGWNSE